MRILWLYANTGPQRGAPGSVPDLRCGRASRVSEDLAGAGAMAPPVPPRSKFYEWKVEGAPGATEYGM